MPFYAFNAIDRLKNKKRKKKKEKSDRLSWNISSSLIILCSLKSLPSRWKIVWSLKLNFFLTTRVSFGVLDYLTPVTVEYFTNFNTKPQARSLSIVKDKAKNYGQMCAPLYFYILSFLNFIFIRKETNDK